MPYNIPTNVSDPTVIAANISREVSILGPGVLFLVYIALAGSGYFAQERKYGHANLPMWLTIAGLITTTIAFMLYLVPGIINLETLSICLVVFLGSAVWYFLSENK